jgi:hypothetical protein
MIRIFTEVDYLKESCEDHEDSRGKNYYSASGMLYEPLAQRANRLESSDPFGS